MTDTPKQGNGAAGVERRSQNLEAALVDLWITLLDEGDGWSPDEIQEYLETARKLRWLLLAGPER